MSLANGRTYLAIPGPSVVPDEVLRAMHRASPNIYEGELVDMMGEIVPDLKKVARTNGNVAIYISNGHGAWEAALANTLVEGDTVLVPTVGRFGLGWAEMARGLGINTQMLDFGRKTPIDVEGVAAALREDTEHKIKAIPAVHVDTSTGLRSDIAGLRRVLDETGHPALLMVDCIASLGCDVFEMDAWGADIMVAGSQKGLMVPPGLGFVFFNDKAAAQRATLKRVSRYWDWVPRARGEFFYEYFGGTAPTHHLHGLRVALQMIHDEGMEQVWARHKVFAQAIWAAVDTWSQDGPLKLNVADPEHRSHAVTTLHIGREYAGKLRAWTEEHAGVTLGIGLPTDEPEDPMGNGYFRFGHMGHLNSHMVLGLLATVETALSALDIPHRAGGVAAAGRVIAQASRASA